MITLLFSLAEQVLNLQVFCWHYRDWRRSGTTEAFTWTCCTVCVTPSTYKFSCCASLYAAVVAQLMHQTEDVVRASAKLIVVHSAAPLRNHCWLFMHDGEAFKYAVQYCRTCMLYTSVPLNLRESFDMLDEKIDTVLMSVRQYSQQIVSLAKHNDWKQWQTASLTLSGGNKMHLSAPLKLNNYHLLSLLNSYRI